MREPSSDTQDNNKISLTYIASQGHSGSTLLAQLLGRHSKVFSLGEIANLNDLEQKCTCNAPSILQCSFWQRVDAELANNGSRSLRDMDIRTKDFARFSEDNLALFRAILAVSGATTLVDASKVIFRLDALARVQELDIIPVFLRRHPAGVVNSNVRKGRNWLEHTFSHYGPSRQRVEYFREMPHVGIDYSELVANPEDVLQALMSDLGLEYEPSQLRWAEGDKHDVGGNRMRFSTDSKILLDDRWKSDLNPFQKTVINTLLNDRIIESDTIAKIAKVIKPIVRPGRNH